MAVDPPIPAIHERMDKPKLDWKVVLQKVSDLPMQDRVMRPYPVWDASGRMTFGESERREQHSEDWTSWIGPEGSQWRVCFRSVLLDLLPTRKAARTRIREYKAYPELADAAEVQLS